MQIVQIDSLISKLQRIALKKLSKNRLKFISSLID
jgi:hypothetical protein